LSHPPADALWVRVYYEDTDSSGRVYHASYLRFLERGRTEWLRHRGFAHQDLARQSGIVFVVRSLQMEFLAPAVMDDLLIVETSVAALRGASIEFKQRVVRSDKTLVTAELLVASIRDGRPERIPADLRRRLIRRSAARERRGRQDRESRTGCHGGRRHTEITAEARIPFLHLSRCR
jgi:acyl-CoA thioester hydrolase